MTTTQYINSLKLIHKLMILIIVSFALIVGWIVFGNGAVRSNAVALHSVLKFAGPIVALVCVIGSAVVYKTRIDAMLNTKYASLSEKLADYRGVVIARYAMLEFGILVNVIALFLTSQNLYIAPIAILLVLFMLYAPSREQIAAHLQLGTAEQHIIFDEYADL